jgi:adenylate cyclase
MAIEIERKFLVLGDGWRTSAGVRCRQGYLSHDKHRTVRVRIEKGVATLTVKGLSTGAVRAEYEYAIPVEDAEEMLALCHGVMVDKTRHRFRHAGTPWVVDEFHGENAGLVVAEVELRREDESFARPDWLGPEVTHDPRFFNSSLSLSPYRTW